MNNSKYTSQIEMILSRKNGLYLKLKIAQKY